MKIKKFKEFFDGLEGKIEWSLPLIEVLVFLPVLLAIANKQWMILYFDDFYVCTFGKMLLETAFIKQSFIWFVLAFIAFALKIVATFFMLKKSKWGYFATITLYLIDYITSLVLFCTCETSLQELHYKDLCGMIVCLFIAPFLSCYYLHLYFRLIQNRKKTKEVKIFTSIVFLVFVLVVSFVWINGNRKIASESEVATLNRCYEYSEKYLYEELPENKMTLEKMQNDIEDVFNSELFFTAFNQSKYFYRMKEEQKPKKNIPIQLKSIYANELMYLKSKILLKLDKDDEYIAYYFETRQYFSGISVEYFYKYLEQDIHNYSIDDCETLKKASVEFMKADVNRLEKLWASIDYSKAAGKDLTEEERQKIAKQIREEILPDYSIKQIKEDLIESEKYNAEKRSLYMLK